jgi:hypothetical protein
MRRLFYLVFALLFATPLLSTAQISITGGLPFTYSENFNSFNGMAPTPAGWTATGTFTYRGIGNGSSNTGGVWAYGTSGDYGLGALCSGSSNNITFTVSFVNNSGTTITGLNISYDFKQWRWGGGNTNSLSASQTGIGASVSNLSQASAASGGTNGTAAVTPKSLSLTGLSIAAGASFSISWNITDGSGSDNSVAIDNFSLTATGSAPCTTPNNPTNFQYTIVSPAQTDVNFTAATPAPTGYIAVRSTNATLSANPVSGTNYNVTDNIGGGTVIYKGAATNFSSTGLNPLLDYYYFIFAYNNTACTGGPLYSTALSGVDSLPAPVITAGPTDSTACPGTAASFSITATNPIAYQWQEFTGSWTNITNNAIYSGATSSTLAISDVTGLNGHQYRCVVTGSLGHTTTSATANLFLRPNTSIAAQPANAVACENNDTSFRVRATGYNLTYQWQENQGAGFTNVSNSALYNGATTDSLVLTTTTASMNGYTYRCIIHNGCGHDDTTTVATLTVHTNPAATITAGGALSFCQNDSVVLQANTGTGFTYQWLLNGGTIGSATNNHYAAYNGGVYSVRITDGNQCSTVSSNDTVTIFALPAANITPAGNSNICAGSSITLNANTGAGLIYQWQENNSNIPGATNAAYTAANNSSYTVTVTNTNGCKKTSAPATVTVMPFPVATAAATSNTTICQGNSVTIYMTPTPGISYQWLLNGNTISGATSDHYDATASGNYSVLIANVAGCSDTSNAIPVTMIPVLPATITPAGALTFCQGDSVRLKSSTLAGATYQWRYNGNNIPAATDSTYKAVNTGNYTVVVTNASGCPTTSAPIGVTVNPTPNSVISYTSPLKFCQDGAVVLTASIPTGMNYQWIKDGNPIPGANAYSYICSQTGNYSLLTTNSYSCNTASGPVSVTVYAKPQPAITRTNYTLSTGNYVAYKWYYNSQPIPGATNKSYTATQNGGYFVEVTDSNGCVNRAALLFINNVGITTVNQQAVIKIYPNPVSDIVHVEAPFRTDLMVRDQLGKLVFDGRNTSSVDMSSFADGMYFISIFDADHQFIATQKISKTSR